MRKLTDLRDEDLAGYRYSCLEQILSLNAADDLTLDQKISQAAKLYNFVIGDEDHTGN